MYEQKTSRLCICFCGCFTFTISTSLSSSQSLPSTGSKGILNKFEYRILNPQEYLAHLLYNVHVYISCMCVLYLYIVCLRLKQIDIVEEIIMEYQPIFYDDNVQSLSINIR